ncbi:MAG: class I SAM-dependent methyltransferase [Acidimicrobiales bacterium]
MRAGAPDVVDYLTDLFGRALPVRIAMWDGSEAGPPSEVTVRLRSPDALRHMLWSPGELGVARAYVTGALDVEGDFEAGLRQVLGTTAGRRPRIGPRLAYRGLKMLTALGALGGPIPRPASEAQLRGRRHSPARDASVIRHHYDLSNRFYSLLLDPSMAYSCAYWSSDRPGYGLEDAQRDKLDLICRKLDLRPGATLLDVGCGWGSLTVHAAQRFGASVTAVTVSREQHTLVQDRLAQAGVSHLVDLRLSDYRHVLFRPERQYDAVAAVEMSEHVGEAKYAAFLSGVRTALAGSGRFLLQVMSRPGLHPGGGPFIERYIAPDMHMRPLHRTLQRMSDAGLEVLDVESMRLHYAKTIRAWHWRLEERWEEVVDLIGEVRARVWRLYLASGILSFEASRMGVDQIVAVMAPTPIRAGEAGSTPVQVPAG